MAGKKKTVADKAPEVVQEEVVKVNGTKYVPSKLYNVKQTHIRADKIIYAGPQTLTEKEWRDLKGDIEEC